MSNSGLDVLHDLSPQGASHGGEGDGDGHLAIVVNRGPFGHAELDNVGTKFWVNDTTQEFHDVIGGNKRGSHELDLRGCTIVRLL